MGCFYPCMACTYDQDIKVIRISVHRNLFHMELFYKSLTLNTLVNLLCVCTCLEIRVSVSCEEVWFS